MSSETGRKTNQEHWDAAWQPTMRLRPPSRLNIDVRNLTSLLSRYVAPGHRYIEVGCAPGKMLAWVATYRATETWGLDYSETGIRQSRQLFDALQLKARLEQGDFFDSSLPKGAFDIVTSFGFIEHFDDPTAAIDKHLELLAPGGVALITVPNYGGIYGRLQKRLDPENLALHNTAIMNLATLTGLGNGRPGYTARAFPWGRPSPWLLSLGRRMPPKLARLTQYAANAASHLLPVPLETLAPMFVLEVRANVQG
jgi:2-polyprenyl-3-methyl-5-hydroxy-6-metoxy-1,4-benzoquinol methylase